MMLKFRKKIMPPPSKDEDAIISNYGGLLEIQSHQDFDLVARLIVKTAQKRLNTYYRTIIHVMSDLKVNEQNRDEVIGLVREQMEFEHGFYLYTAACTSEPWRPYAATFQFIKTTTVQRKEE